jgi:hypothetical protein
MKLLIPFTHSYGEIKRLTRENAVRAKPFSPTLDFVFKTIFSGKDIEFVQKITGLDMDAIKKR